MRPMRMITAAAAAATLVLLPAPAFADPQGGVAYDATDTTCTLVDREPACAHFTAEAVAAYRLGNDGHVVEDVQVSCTAVSPDAVEMRVDCWVNGTPLPSGSSQGGVATTSGLVDLPPDYVLEVCYSATLVLHWADWTTPTLCTSYGFPVGM